MKERTLLSVIRELADIFGNEKTDNILAGAMLMHKDYFSLKEALIKVLEEMK